MAANVRLSGLPTSSVGKDGLDGKLQSSHELSSVLVHWHKWYRLLSCHKRYEEPSVVPTTINCNKRHIVSSCIDNIGAASCNS